MTPRLLTEYRSALVNNQFLATVACSLDLHKQLDHMSVPLAKSLMLFSAELEKKLDILSTDLGWAPRKKIKESVGEKNFKSSALVAQTLSHEIGRIDEGRNRMDVLIDDGMYASNTGDGVSIPAPSVEEVIMIDDDSEDDSIIDELVQDQAYCEGKPQYKVQDCSHLAQSIRTNQTLEEDVIILDSEEVLSDSIKVKNEGASIKNFDLSSYEGEIIDVDGIDDTNLELCVNEALFRDQTLNDDDVGELAEVQNSAPSLKHPLSDGIEILDDLPTPKQNTDSHGLKPFFWDDLICAPKAAGDIYEALLGAVYLDSGFNIQAVYTVIERTLINRWWPRFELSRSFNSGNLDKNPISDFLTIINKDFECTSTRIRCFYRLIIDLKLILYLIFINVTFLSTLEL
jgi:hypothetical protein